MKAFYERGPVQIWHGDCQELIPVVGAVSCVVTDPPYEITASGGGIVRSRRDLQDTEGFTDCGFDYSILAQFDNWVCFGTLRQVPRLIEAAADRRWMLVTWNKQNPCPLINGNYLPDTEYILHAWRAGNLYGDFYDKARYIIHPLGDKEHGEHPNEKPARVMSKMVRLASDEQQTVLDPFMGSGTTAVVCVRENRRFIGIEQDEHWCEVAALRCDRELDQGRLFAPESVPVATQESLFAGES